MIEIEFNFPFKVNTDALHEALKTAYPSQILGVSTYGVDLKGNMRAISVWCEDATTLEEQTEIQRIVATHDPVFLSLDAQQVLADGKKRVNVTVIAPRPNAAPVVLETAWKKEGQPLWSGAEDWPIPLVNGAGVDYMTASSRGTVVLRVKNGINRSTEALRIICL